MVSALRIVWLYLASWPHQATLSVSFTHLLVTALVLTFYQLLLADSLHFFLSSSTVSCICLSLLSTALRLMCPVCRIILQRWPLLASVRGSPISKSRTCLLALQPLGIITPFVHSSMKLTAFIMKYLVIESAFHLKFLNKTVFLWN